MKQFYLLAVVLCALHVQQSSGEEQIRDYRLLLTAKKHYAPKIFDLDRAEICTEPGLTCQDCRTIITCLDTGNGWETEIIEDCGLGWTCHNGACTDKINPECEESDIPFPCTAVGMFPDPFDCQSYHACCAIEEDTQGRTIKKCDGKHAYDPVSTYCKTEMADTECPEALPVPICENVGQSGPVSGNPSIYYVCVWKEITSGDDVTKVLYPKQHLCANGKSFNNGKCT